MTPSRTILTGDCISRLAELPAAFTAGKTDHQTTGFDAGARGAVPMSTANATDTTITCEWCGNDLEKEEMESPLSSDETICDECYDKHYRFTCHWCEEDEDKEHECNLGSLFILFKPVSAHPPFLRHGQQPRWYSHREREMRPGIYRIVRYPFYWDACLDGGLYADAFEWFGPLTSGMKTNGGYADYDCGPLCRRCQRKLKHAKWHWPGERI